MDVTLSANGVPVHRWSLDARDSLLRGRIDLPASVLARQPVELHLLIDAPSSPWREGTGDDQRMLGIRLRALDVAVQESGPPS